jgi:hypothetical protein
MEKSLLTPLIDPCERIIDQTNKKGEIGLARATSRFFPLKNRPQEKVSTWLCLKNVKIRHLYFSS